MAIGGLGTWAGVLISFGIAVGSWFASGSAKREAAEARQVNERMATAQERMAELMAQRLEALEHGAPPPVQPAIEWEIEWRGGDSYALRNLGTQTATNVRIIRDGVPVTQDLPDGVTLEPLRSHRFPMVGTMGKPMPAEVAVTSEEEPTPRIVPMPAKG